MMLDTSPNIEKFLDCVDRASDQLGMSVPQIVHLAQLRLMPLDSFGRAWANFLDQQKLTPLTTGPRRKQLHDGIHVLTGYGTDLIGEAEVQAFLLGTKFQMVNLMLGLGLLRIIHRQIDRQQHLGNERNVVWKRLWHAYQHGRNSQVNPDTWEPEKLWELPLKEVQAIFLSNGLLRVTNHV
jgi:ubiquinone biosynthesis protein COQ4